MATVIPFPVTESEERSQLRRLLARLQGDTDLPPDIEVELIPSVRQGGFTLSLTGARHRLLAEELVGVHMFPQRHSTRYSYRRLRDAWWYVRRIGEDRWHFIYYCRGQDASPVTSD